MRDYESANTYLSVGQTRIAHLKLARHVKVPNRPTNQTSKLIRLFLAS